MSRTFLYRPGLDMNADNAVLGGGEVVVKALFRRLQEDPGLDGGIIGRRPEQMDKKFADQRVPDESAVYAEYLDSLAREANVKIPHRIHVVGETRITEDDVRQVLILAQRYDHVTVIAMHLRIRRARLAMWDCVRKNPEFADAAKRVDFCDAEQFLPEMRVTFDDMEASEAYKRTRRQENFGVEKFLSGMQGDYPRTT